MRCVLCGLSCVVRGVACGALNVMCVVCVFVGVCVCVLVCGCVGVCVWYVVGGASCVSWCVVYGV